MRATREPAMRMGACSKIAAAAPVRIGHHRLTAEFVERDVLRRVPRRAGDRQRGEHALRIGRGPLQHLHAAHRSADDREQRVDAELIEQHRLRAHHVGNGDDRKIQPHSLPVAGLIEAGPVEPMQPPTTLEQMMKYLSVSIGWPGPTMISHQPALPVTGCTLATC